MISTGQAAPMNTSRPRQGMDPRRQRLCAGEHPVRHHLRRHCRAV